ncbi:hypothetical protein GeomeDRAFT_1088 [Geobacter metallireducens RCH3]|nr:hypothetical protein GeomeDRAFT_1088 [Geobacter metallireducens RCH3]
MPLKDIKKPSRLNCSQIHASVVLDACGEMGENDRTFRRHEGMADEIEHGRSKSMRRLAGVTAVAAILAASAAFAAEKVALPKGYEKWGKSSEKVINDKTSLFYGIHNIYVDKKTMPAYKKGGPYPEGSRFVVVQYTIRNEGGKPVKGKKSMVVLMTKDKKQSATGGWLFAGFTPEGKPSGIDPVKNCFECHQKEAKERDFVISRYADFKK